MRYSSLLRGAAVAATFVLAGPPAWAEGDIYSRLFEMRQMDRNRDGMVSKEEFLAMVSKLWDTHVLEIKVAGSRMTPEQVKELQKILGRSLGP